MSELKRSLWMGAGLQVLGPACAFASVWVVASGGGVQAQGQFAQNKAWVDFLVVLGTFGFPQGIVYVVNRLGASRQRLAWLSLAYALAFLPLAAWCTVLGSAQHWTGPLGGMAEVVYLAVAAASLVLHALWRGVCLTRDQGAVFALLTVTPAVALCLVVVAQAGQGSTPIALLWSGLASVAAGALVVAAQLRGVQEPGHAVPWRALWKHGTHVFTQALLMALQPLLAYALVRHFGGGDTGVGLLHVGVFLIQGLVVPISLIAPLLFARWTSRRDESLLRRLAVQARSLAWVGVLGGLALAALVGGVLHTWGGDSYQAAAVPASLLVLTLPLAAWTRLVAPALHAHGAPQANTFAAAWRLAVLALGGAVLAREAAQPHVGVAWAWTWAELASWGWTWLALRKRALELGAMATPEVSP